MRVIKVCGKPGRSLVLAGVSREEVCGILRGAVKYLYDTKNNDCEGGIPVAY